MKNLITAGIRQYYDDLAAECGCHKPARELSLLRRVHDDAEDIADRVLHGGAVDLEQRMAQTLRHELFHGHCNFRDLGWPEHMAAVLAVTLGLNTTREISTGP